MRKFGVIGAKGFVGSNLMKSDNATIPVTRENISAIGSLGCQHFVVSAVSATKWKANLNPERDQQEITALLSNLHPNSGYSLTLISTIDVFPRDLSFTEKTPVEYMERIEGYGKNRAWLECELKDKFEDLTIVRLPGLFGPGLKKNLIFDLLHKKPIVRMNPDSHFQFYDIRNLAQDLSLLWNNDLKVQNMATEPVSVAQILSLFSKTELGVLDEPSFHYKMKTINSAVFGEGKVDYIQDSESVLREIKDWIGN